MEITASPATALISVAEILDPFRPDPFWLLVVHGKTGGQIRFRDVADYRGPD